VPGELVQRELARYIGELLVRRAVKPDPGDSVAIATGRDHLREILRFDDPRALVMRWHERQSHPASVFWPSTTRTPRPTAVTGVGVIASGPLLVAAGLTGIAVPWRAPHAAGGSLAIFAASSDIPAHGKGRRYIIERGLSRMDELRARSSRRRAICDRVVDPPCEETR
jgi:hypothetical protein